MTENAGQIFKGLIEEYKVKAERSEQLRAGFPKPPGLGAFWLDSNTGILYVAAVDEECALTWKQVRDVMGPKPLRALDTDGPDESWI